MGAVDEDLPGPGGRTGGRPTRNNRKYADWDGRTLVRQLEVPEVIGTSKDYDGEPQRPFADLCLTTWLRRRRGHNFAPAFAFLNPQRLRAPASPRRRSLATALGARRAGP